MPDPRPVLEALRQSLTRLVQGDEVLLLYYAGEASEFVRFNGTRLRQAGQVFQHEARVQLIRGRKQIEGRCGLGGDPGQDHAQLTALLQRLRALFDEAEADPHLNYATQRCDSVEERQDTRPDSRAALTEVIAAAEGLDLVGLWTSGSVWRGFCNSLGQRNWFIDHSFHLDTSLHLDSTHAVKLAYAARCWEPQVFQAKLGEARRALEAMARPDALLAPGRYRVVLAPQALAELVGLLAHGGFGLKQHKTLQTPLIAMLRDDERLDPRVTLREDHSAGYTPRFTSRGFIKPEAVTLIDQGVYRDCLADERSAREFATEVNADAEVARSLTMEAGEVTEDSALAELGDGLYIGNLWYANYSDISRCRFTATTRFGSFKVENGRRVAPLATLRLDDSLYHLLGQGLLGLTRRREELLDPGTYEARSLASMRLPGALVDGVRFAM